MSLDKPVPSLGLPMRYKVNNRAGISKIVRLSFYCSVLSDLEKLKQQSRSQTCCTLAILKDLSVWIWYEIMISHWEAFGGKTRLRLGWWFQEKITVSRSLQRKGSLRNRLIVLSPDIPLFEWPHCDGAISPLRHTTLWKVTSKSIARLLFISKCIVNWGINELR